MIRLPGPGLVARQLGWALVQGLRAHGATLVGDPLCPRSDLPPSPFQVARAIDRLLTDRPGPDRPGRPSPARPDLPDRLA